MEPTSSVIFSTSLRIMKSGTREHLCLKETLVICITKNLICTGDFLNI